MSDFNREKVLEFTERMIRTGTVTEGYHTQMMEVLSPELVEMDEMWARFRYPIKEWQRNAFGGLQGGQLASMIDNSIGLTAIPRCGGVVSVNLEISYLAPILRHVDHIEIVTRLKKKGNLVVYINSEVFLPDGTLAADAVSNVMRLPMENMPDKQAEKRGFTGKKEQDS